MSLNSTIGNRITENALDADDGRELIARALEEIRNAHGWRAREEKPLFSGHYYDPKKVGSFITRVTNDRGDAAVLKLQLRPLPFDEGSIIRHIQPQIVSQRIRLPRLITDEAWSEARGYGYLVMEDVSHLSRLWTGERPTDAEMERHTDFLQEFMHHVLPITSFLPAPDVTVAQKYRESFDHFQHIARASSHPHVTPDDIEAMKTEYVRVLDEVKPDGFHFTHGHLSGKEITEDPSTGGFIVFSNLLWSFRADRYEVVFPLWVDLMGIRDANVDLPFFLERIDRWSELWKNVQGEDPRTSQTFWFSILERSMMTVMLDLGASDWRDEQKEKAALLEAWKKLFSWIVKERF